MFEEITEHTMAIIPVQDVEYQCKLINVDGEVLTKKSPLSLIRSACIQGGSTYDGRREAMSQLSGVAQRVPIPISPERKIYAYPTHSPREWECSWIFYYHVKQILDNEKNATIIFQNGKSLNVNISPLSLNRQMQRTAHCILRLSQVQVVSHNLFKIG